MKSILIPPQAYELKIDESNTFITLPKKGQQRIIFANSPLKPEEAKSIDEFRDHCTKNAITFPSWVDDDNRVLLRFLQGNNFNIKKTVTSLQEHIKWKEQLKINVEDAKAMLPFGFMYFFGRDLMFRPIFIITIRKMLDMEIKHEMLMNLLLYLMEWATTNMLIVGKVESMCVIIDLTKVGVTEIPIKLLSSIINLMQNNYRGRLFRMYICNAPFLISTIMKLVKPMLESFTQEKINMIGDNTQKLFETIPADQVEVKYGGKAPNQVSFIPDK